MENSNDPSSGAFGDGGKGLSFYVIVLLLAAAGYAGCMISPPSLMDDVDAVQAEISRNMLSSGDWVTARLDGIPYLEKAPLIYWLMALCFRVFGAYDWAARIPIVLSALALAWLTTAFGSWAFGRRAGFYAGVCISTCFGLFLFTRILIPDVLLTADMTLSMWAFLRALEEREERPRLWARLLAISLGASLLLKSLIGVVFPLAAGTIYLAATRQLLEPKTWRRLRPGSGALIALAIAAPWHILATLRNPPYFDWSWRSAPGEYHGFLWFFFMNEQVLRFLNLRYPRDYNTVPRVYFWLLHLIWLFPWSVYLPAAAKLSFRAADRAGRTRLLALCWAGFIVVFFTFSTTQEYYSMPAYPALALLIGSALAAKGAGIEAWTRRGTRALSAILFCAAMAAGGLWWAVRDLAAPGDISSALRLNPGAYTLSLGHIEDLTLRSFAYLRTPLLMAAAAFLTGALGAIRAAREKALLAAALMSVLFFQAARMALVVFDPYMSSRPLAEAIRRAPRGKLIVDHHYYTFSSIFFYANCDALLLNGRINNLVYGSYAPGAPNVFIDDQQWKQLWSGPERYYLVASRSALPRLEALAGREALNVVAESGGKMVFTNRPLPSLSSLKP
ncbi:MAG TPA: glycosyltransferase family 39 protein [Bryobacteraceae bacterium]|nr:glycosyltransferase family 39 protein [Bryobacteraceae bacterium]